MIQKRGSGKKRETRWTGYKVHLTETCEEDAPHLRAACGDNCCCHHR
jgi:hypothetical protein